MSVAQAGAMTIAVADCHSPPKTAPGPLPAATACPAPAVDTDAWIRVSDSAGVAYRLPPTFVERPDTTGAYRRWDGADGRPVVQIGFLRSPEHWLSVRRVPALGMHEMSECIDSIPAREMLVQTWRMAGGAFRGGRRLDTYEVLALIPIEPGLTLLLYGGGPEREAQILLLAAARTVRVTVP